MTARTKREKEVRALALKAITSERNWRSIFALRKPIDDELKNAVDRLQDSACVWLCSPATSSDITKARKYADAAKLVGDLRASVARTARRRREQAALEHLTAPRKGMAR